MNRYYFTYGTSSIFPTPYSGGWTVVEADSHEQAVAIFIAAHNYERYSICYDEESFMKTKMYTEGNFGKFAHETIRLERIIHDA